MSSYIPKKLLYVALAEHLNPQITSRTKEAKHLPSFVVDQEKEKTIKTAQKWAGEFRYEVEMENLPIENVRIVGLEERGNGGRAYKALIHKKYLVDIREDEVLDSMLTSTIEKGIIKDIKFIWMKRGSQMKLVRYGSKSYLDAMVQNEKLTRIKVSAKDLVQGKIYDNSHSTYIFLGFVKYSTDCITTNPEARFGGRKYIGKWNNPAKAQLWLSIRDGDKEKDIYRKKGEIEGILNRGVTYTLEIKKSSIVYENDSAKIHNIKSDTIQRIQEKCLEDFLGIMKTVNYRYHYHSSSVDLCTMAPYPNAPIMNSELLNLMTEVYNRYRN